MSDSIPLIFENEHLAAVDKPCGYLSVPSRMGTADPRPVVGLVLQKQLGRQIYPIHRLDEETSGLLLFAKTPPAQTVLSRAFEQHQVQKTYQAMTTVKDGFADLRGQLFQNKLVRGKKRSFQADHGQFAETLVVAITPVAPQYLLWTLRPTTGRSHQLRVQLAMRGFPLLGDGLYASTESVPSQLFLPALSDRTKAIALRAISLEFKASAEIKALGLPLRLTVPGWGQGESDADGTFSPPC